MKKYLFILTALLMSACYAGEPAPPVQEQTVNGQQLTARLSVNRQHFELTLENNPAAKAFAEFLPLELNMQDHLNNEKYAKLPNPLPAGDKRAGRIEAGDVMLFQGDTLVVFYESFDSSYRYTKIGKIKNPNALKQALGKNDVQVKWHME